MIKQITLMGKIRLQREAEKIKNILKDQSGMSVIVLLLIYRCDYCIGSYF